MTLNRNLRRLLAAALCAILLPGSVPRAAAEAAATPTARPEVVVVTREPAVTPDPAVAGYARDISLECLFNGKSGENHALTDGTYARDFTTGIHGGAHALEITAPAGEVIGALYIQWHMLPVALNVQVQDEDGEWVTVTDCDGDFYAQYIPVPNLTECRIVARENPMTKLVICEMKVLTPGTPPDSIQVWQKPDKVDMMLIAGHPDDELLWFGGTLPYYAGELKKSVLVVCAAMNRSYRRLELLDALWACGVRTHPVHCVLLDFTTTSMDKVFQEWGGKNKLLKMFTEYYRRYKPDVVLLHDVHGEYGHGIHRTVSWLGRECAELAPDESVYPEQVEAYGTWDVPKIYIHLYEENRIQLDWDQPLTAFDGRTAIQVAADAMYWHKSQTQHGWEVTEGGEMDNSLFGLYRTLVGPDTVGKDFFENIGGK